MWTWPDAITVEDPRRMAQRLSETGIDINLPYLCSRAAGDEKKDFEARLHGLIEEAHRAGQKVYGCFDELNAYEAMPVYYRRQAYRDGRLNKTLCPAHPETREYVLGELRRFVHEFDLDGINLEDGYVFHHASIYDPAHTPGSDYRIEPVCYCEYCRAHAPIEKPVWTQWRQEQLTSLIAEMAKLIRQAKSDITFSAAARLPYDASFYASYASEIPYYSGWKHCQSRDGFSADWVQWLQRGYLDFVCPMSYHHNDRIVQLETMECQHEVPQVRELAWIGLGLSEINAEYTQGIPGIDDPNNRTYDSALLNDAAAIKRQMQIQADAGQQNCLFFSYAFLREEHIPVIAGFSSRLA
jgi:uncharacterized lipoprotein YddW (UPF0748 family)